MPRVLHEILSPIAAARPEGIAVCWKDETVPYGELDRLTNQTIALKRVLVPPGKLHFSTERFLSNQIRERFGFVGTPIVITTRTKEKRSPQK